MATRVLGPTGSRRRRRFLLAPISLVALIALFAISSASGVLPGSPSSFESGNDPTLGLGNMIVNTTGNTDWISVTNEANYVHLADTAASTSDDSFTPGQKQDTVCPTIEGHKNPPKDDFTDVASFNEVASGGANDGDVYLYGATIRYAANGNASENIELKQGTSGFCPGSTTLLARTPGDKLIAIDYLGGGSAVEFHVLTWVATGPCFVANDPAPCWGATVLELDPTEAEGGVNASPITAAQNPISGVPLVAGQFAEFGVNLTESDIIPEGECAGFSQTIWESRSAGSSFVSSTKDITIEDQDINVCGSVDISKVGSDGGSQLGAVFTLYAGDDVTDPIVGTCTVDASGDCVNDDPDIVSEFSFPDLDPGTYTIDETVVPAGYSKDPNLPETFTVAQGESVTKSYTDPALEGALSILKNSTKGGAVLNAGAEFSYDSSTVIDNGTGDEDSDIGEICVSGLDPGDYTVNETSPPDGYGDAPASEADQLVTVVNGTNCTDALPGAGATATFTNPPLADIIVAYRDGGSGETSLTSIDCAGLGATPDTLDSPALSGWDASATHLGIPIDPSPRTITCTIVIDP
jgi:Prealbumin-like fold domain